MTQTVVNTGSGQGSLPELTQRCTKNSHPYLTH